MTRPHPNRKKAHPSRGDYVHGCRCEGCKEENTRYIRFYRNRGGTSVYREEALPKGDSMLDTMCWCEGDSKLISADEVAAGRTWTCGPDCSP